MTIDLESLANEPRRMQNTEGSTDERSVDEIIKAKQFVAQESAATLPPFGLRMARTRPGGTVN